MKYIKPILLSLALLLKGGVVLSEELNSYEDLVWRGENLCNNTYFKKGTNVPFTGKLIGKNKCTFKNGKREGVCLGFNDNGGLSSKVFYLNGKPVGELKLYHRNGLLYLMYFVNENCEMSGHFESYWDNGQLESKGNMNNGEEEGRWVEYKRDGFVNKQRTGLFKNGVKISE